MRRETGAGVSNLNEVAAMWASPRGEDAESAGHPQAQDSLTGMAGLWSTPRGSANENRTTGYAPSHLDGTHGRNLAADAGAFNWPTPQASEQPNTNANQKNMPPALGKAAEAWQTPKAPSGGNTSRGHDRKDEPLLDGQAQQWATPMAADDGKKVTPQSHQNSLIKQSRSFLPPPTTQTDGQPSLESGPTSRRRLNPMFVEWLMNWAPGWTSLEPLDYDSPGMASYRFRQRTRFASLCGDLEDCVDLR